MKKWLIIIFLSIIFIFTVIYFTQISVGKLLVSLNDGTTAKNITFTSAENHIFNLTLPKNATVISAKLNLSGFGTTTTTVSYLWVLDQNTIGTTDYIFNYTYTDTSLTFKNSIAIGGATMYSGDGLTFNGTDYWIVDTSVAKVSHYNSGFGYIDQFSLNVSKKNKKGITKNGTHLYVCEYTGDLVYIYTMGGVYVTNWVLEGISNTECLRLDDNVTHIWVYDSGDDKVYFYNWDGTYIGPSGGYVTSDYPSPFAYKSETEVFGYDSSPTVGTNKQNPKTGSLIQFYAFESTNDLPTSMEYAEITLTPSSNSSNLTLDVTNDGDIEFNHTGTFNTMNQTNDFSGELNAYLATCTAVNGNCTIPMNLSSGSAGIVQINDIQIVYLIPTAPILESPPNNTYHKSNVSFNCSAESDTDPLKNISLWVNISGTWKENISTIKTGTSNYSNWTLWNIPEGIYIYNCLATNQNGSNWTSAFASSNYTFTIDVTNPVLGQSGLNDTIPRINDNIQFYQNFSDLYQLDYYIFSWNGTGTWENFSVDISGQNHSAVQNKTLTVGRDNIVNYYFWVNDSSGNININNTGTIIVNNTFPTFIQTLTTQSVKTPNTLNYDVNCTDADSDTISYTINDSKLSINSATGVITDSPTEDENATLNINITCHDGFNNNSNQFNYMIADGTPPSFSIPQNSTPATYSPTTLSFFNITITSLNGGVNKSFISNNFTGAWNNLTLGNITNIYNLTTLIPSGSFSYSYWTNDSYNNINTTIRFNFTINKVTPTCTLSLSSSPVTYGVQSMANCSCDNSNGQGAKLYRNGTDVTSAENATFITLSGGLHNYVCNVTESQNYTSATSSGSITINQASTQSNLTLNGAEANLTLTYSQTITAIYNWINKSADMFRNGTNINTENNTAKTLAVGYYNYTVEITSNQNYTASIKTFFLTINKNISYVDLLINGTSANKRINYSLSANITARLITGDTQNIQLYRNNTLLLNGTSEIAWIQNLTTSLDIFEFCSNYTESQNYTSNSTCRLLTVVDEILPSFSNNLSGGTFKKYTNFTYNITTSDRSLNYTWFSTNNSGLWTNNTPIALNGATSYVFNNSNNISLSRGNTICSIYYTNDSSGNLNVSNQFCFSVVNTVPIISSAAINDSDPIDSDNLYCDNRSVSDIDGDSIILFYDWLNSSVSTGISNPLLGNANTSVNDIWQCRIWVGDTYDNGTNVTSSSVSIGTGYIAPIINFTNATTVGTGKQSDSANPTNNNTLLNISVNITDVNTGDNWTAIFCRTDSFSGTNCTSSTDFLCSSKVNTSYYNLWCTMNISSESAGSFTYYSLVIDNTSLSSSSKSGSAWINHPPTIPTIISPLNTTRTNKNWSLLESSCTDLNVEDTITYSYYNNLSGVFTLLYNGTSSSYNFSSLNETNYYWLANCKDDSNYSIYNSSIYQFDNDFTSPNSTINNPINDTIYLDASYPITIPHNFTLNTNDTDDCFYNVTLSTGGAVISNTNINCTNPPTGFNISISAGNMTYALFINDTANNIAVYQRLIHTSLSSSSPGSGGGGGGAVAECYVYEDCESYGSLYYCKNYKCVINETSIITVEPSCGDGICQPEFGEDIIQCSQDCPLQKNILSSCFDKDISNDALCFLKQRWFFVLATLLGLVGIAYLLVTIDKKNKSRRFEL